MISDSNDETTFPHKLLLTDAQVLRLRKGFAEGSSANVKLIKTHLSKMVQLGWLVSKLLGQLVQTALSL